MLWLVLLSWATAVHAESGTQFTLPVPRPQFAGGNPNPTRSSGLILRIDTRWVESRAYRPVTVTLSTNTGSPTPRDRVLWVELRAFDPYNQNNAENRQQWVGKLVELPQGEREVKITILMPQEAAWHGIFVRTFEDGTQVEELSGEDYTGSATGRTEANPSILILHADAPTRDQRSAWITEQKKLRQAEGDSYRYPLPDLRVMYNEFEGWGGGQNASKQFQGVATPEEMLPFLPQFPRLDILPLAQSPEHWLGLSGVDLLFIRYDDLEEMRNNLTTRFTALEEWILAGGTVVVWYEEPVRTPPQEALRLFHTQPLENRKFTTPPQGQHSLSPNDLRNGSNPVYGYPYQANQNYGTGYEPLFIDQDGGMHFNVQSLPAADMPTVTRLRGTYSLGFGMVAVIPGSPFPGTPQSWEQLAAQIGSHRWAPFQRLGLSRGRINQGFWEFLIPGVGMAPVTSFLVLISLFVIVIGPVNYFLLRAMRRLNWLVFTVPLGAFIVTGTLMIYAVFADGFSTRTRIRSLTLLDQVESRGANYSLQAYYAGLAPSSGLHYPTDTAIHLREHNPHDDWQGNRELHWRDDQWLKQGYFRSRVTRQLLAIRPFETERRLEIQEGEDQGGLRVTNLLDTPILHAIVIDPQGTPFQIERLAPGESVQLAADGDVDKGEMRRLLTDANMETPPGFVYRANYRSGRRNRHYSGYFIDTHLPDPSFTSSALERELDKVITAVLNDSQPYSYLAVVEHFPEVPWGVEGVPAGELSIDIVYGRWGGPTDDSNP
ncbi:MAG: hypothetical protein WDZ51_10610 [Pirellulaceae bacterium]